MKKPEWKKELEKSVSNAKTELNTKINAHTTVTSIHRVIHLSTVSPTNTEGNDGDIWITYEA